jgi:Family of unknown function (DUF6069)
MVGMPRTSERKLMFDHKRRRLVTVLLAPSAALVAWGVIRLIGVDLVLKSGRTVGPSQVFAAALVGALAGWVVARWIGGHSRRPRPVWTFVGTTALAASTIGPSWLADGAAGVALVALHFVTAIVVILGFAGTLPVRRPAGRTPAQVTNVMPKS